MVLPPTTSPVRSFSATSLSIVPSQMPRLVLGVTPLPFAMVETTSVLPAVRPSALSWRNVVPPLAGSPSRATSRSVPELVDQMPAAVEFVA